MSFVVYPSIEVALTKPEYAITKAAQNVEINAIESQTLATSLSVGAASSAPLQMSGYVCTLNPFTYVRQTAGDGWTNAALFSTKPATTITASYPNMLNCVGGFGLSQSPSVPHDENGFTFAFIFINTYTQIRWGADVFASIDTLPTDTFRIDVRQTSEDTWDIDWLQNGTIVFQISGETIPPPTTLYPDFTCYNTGATYSDVSYS